MDFDEYRKKGKEMVDYIADYLENIRDRRVFPDVKPGYMRNLMPDHAPLEGENWDTIVNDVERVIMPGITHWQSPHMHAYFPALNSFPSLLADMLADAINCLGFTWASSPAATELETIVMNWLGKMIGLPDEFLHTPTGRGGGVIQTTASESTLICLLAGRTQAICRFHESTPGFRDAEINARLVAYCSDQAHSSVEKAALIGLVRMRYIESDDKLSLRGAPLREAIQDDIQLGLIPFWVCTTLGTTGSCAFDNLEEIGRVCKEFKLWLHVDAAYAGSAFICPEFRVWLKGIENADSIAFNPSKWLMVHFDCTAMWVKNSGALHRTFNVEPLYLQHENSGLAIDYMHWQIPLSKRFRALKLWFVIRNFGIKGLQKHIREGVRLAQKFEALVLADSRFEIPSARHLGLVVFRLKGDNELTERLLKRLNHRGKIHCVPSSLKGKYIIRFTVTSSRTTGEDIIKDWAEIRYVASEILAEQHMKITDRARVPLKDTREKNEAFGSSLLLANGIPMSPKVVNGSFAAIFDADEFLAKAYAGVRIANQDSPAMRRRVRGILMSGKQFSLDSRMDLVVHGIDTAVPCDTDRAISEDCEENWEVCENSAMMMPLSSNGCRSFPIRPPKQFRSLSMAEAVRAQNNYVDITDWNYNNFPSPYPYTFNHLNHMPTSVNNAFNSTLTSPQLLPPLPLPLSSSASSASKCAKRFVCQNLNCIDENESLELLEETESTTSSPESVTITSDFGRRFPEKRQSEPTIQYSFINHGFQAEINATRKFPSQNDIAASLKDPTTNGGTDWKKLKTSYSIDYAGGEDSADGGCSHLLPIITINTTCGETINHSLDSSDDLDYLPLDNFTSKNHGHRSKKMMLKEPSIHISSEDDDDETIYENIKLCRKCGHKSLNL